MILVAALIFAVAYIVAIVGIFLPVLPGIPIAALGTILAAWLGGFKIIGSIDLAIVLSLTALSIILDYFAGVIGAKKFGAQKAGIIGSIIGSLIGLIFFPPFGFLFGALAGAIVAELLSGRELPEALKAGFGVLVGTLGGMLAKLFIVVAIGIVIIPNFF